MKANIAAVDCVCNRRGGVWQKLFSERCGLQWLSLRRHSLIMSQNSRLIEEVRHLDFRLRAGVEVLARWQAASLIKQEPARVIEIRPHSLQVETNQGETLILPRAHSVRWSETFGAFPAEPAVG
jgi:hypothetical protein